MSNRLIKIGFTLCVGSLVAACTVAPLNTTTPAGSFNTAFAASKNIDPVTANACITSAANKYYLPTRVIKAVGSKKSAGTMHVFLKVDVRDAVCVVSPSGSVRSVIDTTAKSADQAVAEKRAASVKVSASKP